MKIFFIKIILPAILTIILFISTFFFIIIPDFENGLMNKKKEMVKEATKIAFSVLEDFNNRYEKGSISKETVQHAALEVINNLRYGKENKDYFWITDLKPTMILHPYIPSLKNKDLSQYEDKVGNKLFVQSVQIAKEKGEGFLNYYWQWMDDSTHVVEKISFVKIFKPWNWIIGSGIYVEDVKKEISLLTTKMIKTSLIIVLIILLPLLFITYQSHKIEEQKNIATDELKITKDKYVALANASTQGSIMILEGKFFYANKIILNMLGYTSEDFNNLFIYDLISEKSLNYENFKSLIQGTEFFNKIDTQFLNKNGSLINIKLEVSKIKIESKNGFVLVIKDISSNSDIENKLNKTNEKYTTLIDSLKAGIIRVAANKENIIIEGNPAAVEIFGMENRDDLVDNISLDYIFDNEEELQSFLNTLNKKGEIKEKIIQFKKSDGSMPVLSLSFVKVDEVDFGGKNVTYFDGIIRDVTSIKKSEDEREDLLNELQTSLLFLNQPLKYSVKPLVSTYKNNSIKQVAKIMNSANCDVIIILDNEEENLPIGIVTDQDIRERIVAENLSLDTGIYKIMTAPIISLDENTLILDAILTMQQKKIKHIAVRSTNERNNLISVLSHQDLIKFQSFTPTFLLKEVYNSQSYLDIVKTHKKLPLLINSMIDNGAKPKNLTRIISSVSDSIVERLIKCTIEEIGEEPPCSFSFILLGSEGRMEETLLTDQDNAIIFEDIEDSSQHFKAEKYFLKLGEGVSKKLDLAGYNYCKGEIMASNPRWCKPISTWKKYFESWIYKSTPKTLLDINIFFDFREVFSFGKERNLTRMLNNYINKILKNREQFFTYFANNALQYKAPLDFFGKIIVTSDKNKKNDQTLDIKGSITPIINFARLYALKHEINETNTLKRLWVLYKNEIITKSTLEELRLVYNFLMQLRFKHQAEQLTNNLLPNNDIKLSELTDIEIAMLKKIFTHINNFQKKISYDFLGGSV